METCLSQNSCCYVAKGLRTLNLSQGACKDLGLVDKNFPKIGSSSKAMVVALKTVENRVSVGKVMDLGEEMEEFADRL